jgi:hypothetical protein
MFATGCAMGAATLLRAGAGCVELWSGRAPELFKLASESGAEEARGQRAQGAFRDCLIATARDSAEVAIRELRRGIDDLDAFTRPDEERAPSPSRPYKTKP